MKTYVAKSAGMCFGVKNALSLTENAARDAAASGKSVFIIGQLAHNRQLSAYLSGMSVAEISEKDVARFVNEENVFILPSHGKGPSIYDILKSGNNEIVDAVCPCVRQALRKALDAVGEGYFILIFGDRGHDEIAGYTEWLKDACLVVKDYDDVALSGVVLPSKLAIMAQTTADHMEFDRLIGRLKEEGFEPLVIDSICEATHQRRQAALELAERVDLMLVIGGANSANTRKLYEYCSKIAPKTHLIETAEDIDFKWLGGVKSLGITAGASTPEWVIKEVLIMTEEFKEQDLELKQGQESVQAPEQEQVSASPEAAAPEAALPEVAQAAQAVETEAALPEATEPVAAELIEPAPVAAAPESVAIAVEPEAVVISDEPDEADVSLQAAGEQETEANFSDLEAEMGYLDFNPGDIIKGTIVRVSSDEVLVDIGYKSEGIIPSFELAFTKIDPLSVFSVGDEINVAVVKEDRDGNIILSRKNAMYEERIALLEERFKSGEPIQATVIDVVKGGLLVDVGMRGFVPASHVERGFVRDLNEYLRKTLDFKILELNRNGKKVILSRKALLEDEYQKAKHSFWDNVEEGQVKKGTIRRITDFGAFVDIGGCDGLLHVSEMGWGKVGRPSDIVSINEQIEVYILKVDKEKEKVSLSLKKLISNPWDKASEKYLVGSVYPGKVMRVAPFGAFIQLEPSLEGLAHISQIANFRVEKVEDVLTEGMEVPVKVLEIDLDKKRISLSIKAAIDLPRLTKAAPEQATSKQAAREGEAAKEAAEIDVDSFNESATEDGAGALAAALGEAMATKMAEATANTDSVDKADVESEAVAEAAAEAIVEEAAEAVAEAVVEEVVEALAEVVAEEIAEAVDEVIVAEEIAEEVAEVVVAEEIVEEVAEVVAEIAAEDPVAADDAEPAKD